MGMRKHQRLGKRERARVKKLRRGKTWGNVFGAGTYELIAGRKKREEFYRSRRNPFGTFALHANFLDYGETSVHEASPGTHLEREPISKAGT